MALDVNNFITKHILPLNQKIFLMGHSLGGIILMTLLQNHKEFQSLLGGVIIVDISPKSYTDQHKLNLDTTQKLLNSLSNYSV